MTLTARESEPVLCFFSDKAGAGSWNIHLYRAFADPFNTPSLVADAQLREGSRFRSTVPSTATTSCRRTLTASSPRRARRGHVRERRRALPGEVAAVASAGSDPVLIVRCGSPFPAVEEVLEAFTVAYAVGATLGGPSPLVPVSANGDASTRSVGSAIGLGFQLTADRLVGPRDLLGDAAFDEARRQAAVAADYLRRHGPFAPHHNGNSGRCRPFSAGAALASSNDARAHSRDPRRRSRHPDPAGDEGDPEGAAHDRRQADDPATSSRRRLVQGSPTS